MTTRRAYLANRWYPGAEHGCREAIDNHASEAQPRDGLWRALVAPHAGWAFSGDAMGRGYRWLSESNPDVDLVVVYGSHRGPDGPTTVFCDEGWETPLGLLETAEPVALEVRERLTLGREPAVPARPDNAAEVHMPFVKHFFSQAELLMVGVEASERALDIGKTVADICLELGRKPVFVGSTDLTHYGPNYGYSPQGSGAAAVDWVRRVNDRGFLDPLLGGEPKDALEHALAHGSACCPGAVLAAVGSASRVASDSSAPTLVDHYLSADVMPSDSFVGYASVVL